MIAMIGLLGGGTIIGLLSGMRFIKNERLKRKRLRKNSCLLLSIHQDIGIDVYQKMKQKKQKNYGHKLRPFLYLMPGCKKIF